MAVFAFEQQLMAEREIIEGDRQAHQFVKWLLEEGGYRLNEGVAYCKGQDNVWDWDGNNNDQPCSPLVTVVPRFLYHQYYCCLCLSLVLCLK